MNEMQYHPRLEYKKKLFALLKDEESVHGPLDEPLADLPKGEAFKKKYQNHALPLAPEVSSVANFSSDSSVPDSSSTPTYEPSDTLVDALNVTPLDVIEDLYKAKQDVENMIDKIMKQIPDPVAKAPSKAEYIKARDENQRDVIETFEDFHQTDPSGSTETLPLPILLDFNEELDEWIGFTEDTWYSKTPVPSPSEYHQQIENSQDPLERHRQNEEDQIKEWIEQDKKGELDVISLDSDNNLIHFVDERAKMITDFVLDTEHILSEPDVGIHDPKFETITVQLSSSGAMLEQMRLVAKLLFAKQSAYIVDCNQRARRSISLVEKINLAVETREMQRYRDRNVLLAGWVGAMNPEEEDSEIVLFLESVLDGMDVLNNNTNILEMDLYSTTELDRLQLRDFTEALHSIKKSRMLYEFTGELHQYYPLTDEKIRSLGRQFTQKHSLWVQPDSV